MITKLGKAEFIFKEGSPVFYNNLSDFKKNIEKIVCNCGSVTLFPYGDGIHNDTLSMNCKNKLIYNHNKVICRSCGENIFEVIETI